jgi:hypothetical protein
MLVNVPSAAKWREYATASPWFQAALSSWTMVRMAAFVRGRLRAELGCQQSDCKARREPSCEPPVQERQTLAHLTRNVMARDCRHPIIRSKWNHADAYRARAFTRTGSLGDHGRVADVTQCEAITFFDQCRFRPLESAR